MSKVNYQFLKPGTTVVLIETKDFIDLLESKLRMLELAKDVDSEWSYTEPIKKIKEQIDEVRLASV